MVDPGERADNVRAEYAALSSYVHQVTGFRFQLLGFFIAAVGLMAGRESRSTAALLLAVGIGLWGVELRNRTLAGTLAERGRAIEDEWGHAGYFNAQNVRPDTPHVFNGARLRLPVVVTHTLALDVVYCAVVGYAAYLLIAG